MKRISQCLTNHNGTIALPAFIWVAIAFIVGSICLTTLTYTAKQPVNQWHDNVVHQWFNGDGPSINNGGNNHTPPGIPGTNDNVNGDFPEIILPTPDDNQNEIEWNTQDENGAGLDTILWAPLQNYENLPFADKIADYTKDIEELQWYIDSNEEYDMRYHYYNPDDEVVQLMNVYVNGELYQFLTCSKDNYTLTHNHQILYFPEAGLYACLGQNYQDGVITPNTQNVTFVFTS